MIQLADLRFRYPGSAFGLDIQHFHVGSREKLAVIGPSGAGKTTLLKLIAGVLVPDSGEVNVEGVPLHRTSEAERRRFRISRVGFVFQELELLDYLNVFDNIVHTYRVNCVLRFDRGVRARLHALAEEIGLADKLARMPRDLSQGERQRTAICRALLPQPGLLLADEATGNLDPESKLRMLDLLFAAADQCQASIVAVTHDHELLEHFDRVVDLRQLAA